MADDIHEDEEITPGYKPPAEKTLDEIVSADQNDESLKKYKESLLGSAVSNVVIVEPDNPKKVIVKSLTLLVEGRPDMKIDFSTGISYKSPRKLLTNKLFMQIWIPSKSRFIPSKKAFNTGSKLNSMSKEKLLQALNLFRKSIVMA